MLSSKEEEKLNDVIICITESEYYKKCIDIKKQMDKNDELNNIINEVKKLQKLYIKNNDKEIKKELDEKIKYLNTIPIYVEYNNNLEKVNEMINLVKDRLNNYFYNKLNKIDF